MVTPLLYSNLENVSANHHSLKIHSGVTVYFPADDIHLSCVSGSLLLDRCLWMGQMFSERLIILCMLSMHVIFFVVLLVLTV